MTRPTAQEIQDIRDRPKLEKAYNDSLTHTEMRPALPPKPPAPKKEAPKKYAHGGSVARGGGAAKRGMHFGKNG